jgi:aspartyl-tRNA(Asn)/glutamyl-tRNA(Gln) amidotransferase subunit A
MVNDWTRASAARLADAYALGEATPLEVTEAYLAKIHSDRLGAYLSVRSVAARSDARAAGLALRSGRPPGRLAGIPVALKDNLATCDLPTTCASRILEGYVSPYDATVVRRLRAEGAIILGKTNMDEFSMGSSNEHSAFGPVANPFDTTCVPGGSSGGSAAAVAEGLACLALGSDTGGSVRQPAALCGCVGFKPTYGHVSRYGLVAFASSLDQVGMLGRQVRDCALTYDVVAGPDPHDGTSVSVPLARAVEALQEERERITLGFLPEAQLSGLSSEMAATLERVKELLRRSGHDLREVSLPHVGLGTAAYYVIANAEAAANLARFDGVRFGRRDLSPKDPPELYARTRGHHFGPEVKRRIMLGTYVLSAGYYDAYYLRAVRLRNLLRGEILRAFAGADFLLLPTTPTAAWPLGKKRHDPLAMYLSDVFTVTANLAGLPALSLPVGLSEAGLPLGVQLWGRPHSDAALLACAARLEADLGWDPHRP